MNHVIYVLKNNYEYIIFFLPRETKNLERINKLAEEFNKLMIDKEDDISAYSIIGFQLGQIQTTEHKDKVDLYQSMISNIIDIKIEKCLKK